MKIAVCDCRIYRSALKKLEDFCDRIILLPPFEELQEAVASHPDMLIFPIYNEKIILTHGNYIEICKKHFEGTGYDIVAIPEKASAKYPNDILLNAAVVGDRLIGRLPYVSSAIKDFAERKGLESADTRQGYAKCSTCIVSERAIITADPSIIKCASEFEIDTLEIGEGNILLPGCNFGFIGGASGNDGENVYFCGDISAHPDGERIKDFCQKHKKNIISLSSEPLQDVGSIFFL